MKKFLLLLSLMALPFAFVSCGSDDDDNNSLGKVLTSPELQDLAKQVWQITQEANPDELIGLASEIIIKLGEDGTGFVYSKDGKLVESAEACDDPRPGSMAPKAPSRLMKSDQWYVSVVSYTDKGDNVYELSGLGQFSYDPNNPQNVTLKVGQNAVMSLVAQVLASQINLTDLVSKVCRTWVIRQTQVQVSGGDLKDTFGKFYQNERASDLTYIAQSIDQEEDLKNVKMADNLKEIDRYTQIKTVTLSRTGSIAILYANGKMDVGTIQNIDAQGNIKFNWNGANLSNKYISGDLGVNAKITNNYLVLTFNSKVSVENVAQPYKVKLGFTMEWAK